MGYLVRSAGLTNFSKAVMSLWFRVPAASIAAASAKSDAWYAGDRLDASFSVGIIPLLTFGPNTETVEYIDGDGIPFGSSALQPCHIGISMLQGFPTLCARLQYSSGGGNPPPAAVHDFFQIGTNLGGGPQIEVGFGRVLDPPERYITVSADAWHHVLVSFDMSGGCSTSFAGPSVVVGDACTFYWAFDDVNYNDAYLWPNGAAIYGDSRHNGIFSGWSYNSAFAAGNIPTSGKPVGIPSSADQTDNIYNVEMAYLQIFTGVTLDTSVEDNRRAFIKADGTPETDYTIAAALLGKSPEIRFQNGNDFKVGRNTGSLGGTFTKTGTINDFTPGPLL